MELWLEKIISLFVLFAVSLFFGLLPVKILQILQRKEARGLQDERIRAQTRLQTVISYLNCVAGGVFFATSFLHLMPEVEEATEKLWDKLEVKVEFPVAALLSGCGFFLIMLVEHCVMQMQHRNLSVQHSKHDAQSAHTEIESSHDKKNGYGAMDNCDESSSLKMYVHEHQKSGTSAESNEAEAANKNCVHLVEDQHHADHHVNVTQLNGLRAFILLLALSLHTVFEGMALGLQPTSSLLWTLTGAISLHKAVISFTMGLQFCEKLASKKRVVLFLVLFSIMAPIGVGIGTLVDSVGSQNETGTMIANVALQGIATGTFVYVTFFEVLGKEVGQDHAIAKVFAIMAGYAVIAVMTAFLPDPDSD